MFSGSVHLLYYQQTCFGTNQSFDLLLISLKYISNPSISPHIHYCLFAQATSSLVWNVTVASYGSACYPS